MSREAVADYAEESMNSGGATRLAFAPPRRKPNDQQKSNGPVAKLFRRTHGVSEVGQ